MNHIVFLQRFDTKVFRYISPTIRAARQNAVNKGAKLLAHGLFK